MRILEPDMCVERLSDIDCNYWYGKGIRCVLVDLDNTISPWAKVEITDDAKAFIEKSKNAGVMVVLFSNATEGRVREAAWNAGINYYASARKPFPFRYKKAIAELSFCNTQILTIGDQVFTDVLGGNLTGCATILVAPLSEAEYVGTKFLRILERMIVRRKIVFQDELYPSGNE